MLVKILKLAVFMVLVFVVPSFSIEWAMFKGNASRSGFYERKVGVPVKGVGPSWRTKLGGPIVSSPAIDKGILYIGSRDSSIYAVDIITGEILWKVKTGGWVDSSPIIYKNRIFVGSRDKYIYAIDKKTGEVISRYPAGLQLSSPVVYQDRALITGLGPPINGLSAFPVEASSIEIVETDWTKPLPQMSYSSPALYKNIAIIGSSNGVVYAKDAATGEAKWQFATQGGIYLSTPAIDGKRAYISPGNFDRNIYMKENVLESESPVKTFAIGGPQGTVPVSYLRKVGRPTLIHPYVMKKIMWLSPADRLIRMKQLNKQGYQLNKVSGLSAIKNGKLETVNWLPMGGMKTSSVSVGPNNMFVIQKHLGYVELSPNQFEYKPYFILSANDKITGKQSWQFHRIRNSEQLGYASSPIVTNYLNGGEVVFFGWGEGKVYALKNGLQQGQTEPEILWEDKLQGHIISTPALSEGNLFFATMDGYIYKYAVKVAPAAGVLDTGVYAYPNPVRKNHQPVSKIYLDLAGSAATVDIVIYNTAERPVVRKTLQTNGAPIEYPWKVRDVANGVYFAKVTISYTVGGKDIKWIKIALLR